MECVLTLSIECALTPELSVSVQLVYALTPELSFQSIECALTTELSLSVHGVCFDT